MKSMTRRIVLNRWRYPGDVGISTRWFFLRLRHARKPAGIGRGAVQGYWVARLVGWELVFSTKHLEEL